MKPILKCMLGLVAMVGVAVAPAQRTLTAGTSYASTAVLSGPVAYVYVSVNNHLGGSPNQIAGFAAGPDGRLTALPGSPYAGDVTGMVLNGKYLFGLNNDGIDEIDSFSIAGNGALAQVATTNTRSNNVSGCTGAGSMVLDHTGANLYVPVSAGSLCDSDQYQSYLIGKTTGQLSYLGSSQQKFLYNWPLTFGGNNVYAYGSECIDYQGGYLDTFAGLSRKSTGMLTDVTVNIPTPAAKDSGLYYCRSITAADRANHVVVSMQAIRLASASPEGPAQVGTYSADRYGNLYTNSTFANMPVTDVGNVSDMSMSPSGTLVAVAGDAGLQVFKLDAVNGIRHYTGLLTHDSISRVTSSAGLVFWDNANHLYAISPYTSKLYVFTVTMTSVSEAPGSPYTVALPHNLIVLPRTN